MGTTRSYLKRVTQKSDALARARMWPTNDPGKVRYKLWLNNFTNGEVEMAAALIDVFVYFSDEQVTQLLRRVLSRLFQSFCGTEQSLEARRERIRDQLERTLFLPVEGETPNPADSGNYMCRRVRQLLELPDSQVQKPAAALPQYLNGEKTIVFVDDIVGTGQQLHATWLREYQLNNPKSFWEAYKHTKNRCYYISLASTKEGRQKLAAETGIELISAHNLQDRDRFNAALRRIPDHPAGSELHDGVDSLLDNHAAELTLASYMREGAFPLFGFHNLGLTLGFQHSMPDATLPIYWASSSNSWTPLSKRT